MKIEIITGDGNAYYVMKQDVRPTVSEWERNADDYATVSEAATDLAFVLYDDMDWWTLRKGIDHITFFTDTRKKL